MKRTDFFFRRERVPRASKDACETLSPMRLASHSSSWIRSCQPTEQHRMPIRRLCTSVARTYNINLHDRCLGSKSHKIRRKAITPEHGSGLSIQGVEGVSLGPPRRNLIPTDQSPNPTTPWGGLRKTCETRVPETRLCTAPTTVPVTRS